MAISAGQVVEMFKNSKYKDTFTHHEDIPGSQRFNYIGKFYFNEKVTSEGQEKTNQFPILIKIATIKQVNEPSVEHSIKRTDKSLKDRVKEIKEHIQTIYSGSQRSSVNLRPFDPLIQIDSKSEDVKETTIVFYRQFFKTTLYHWIQQVPPLNEYEKQWLVFQVLISVRQLHFVNSGTLWHGSIKPENFVLNSTGNLFLTDIMPFAQPFYYDMADENTYNKY